MAPSFRPLATPSFTTPSSGPWRHYPFPFPGDTHLWRHLLIAASRHPFVITPIRCPLLTPTPGDTLFFPLATPPFDNTTFSDPGNTLFPRHPLPTTPSSHDTLFGQEAHHFAEHPRAACTAKSSIATDLTPGPGECGGLLLRWRPAAEP